MATMEPSATSESSASDYSITVSRLRSELDSSAAEESGTPVTEIVDDVEATLFEDSDFSFEESQIKTSLDELLLSIVALRSSDTHGKQLLDDLAGEFDTVLSPGTVYPRLHELCDDGVLEQRELVKTKEYTLSDDGGARARIAEAARQHLALGMVFQAALEEGDFE